MAERRLFYYITDRTAFGTDESTRRERLFEKIAEATLAGVDYIQLRERDLSARQLEALASEAVRVIKEAKLRNENRERRTALLTNSRPDVALAVHADGVHLRSDDISPQEVRAIWEKCCEGAHAGETPPRHPLIGVSCHSPEEVAQAAANGGNFAVFAPVFEKKDAPGGLPAGVEALRLACKSSIPVLALGGITLSNARSCFEAGAAGIAAIRLFQENDICGVVKHLRSHAR